MTNQNLSPGAQGESPVALPPLDMDAAPEVWFRLILPVPDHQRTKGPYQLPAASSIGKEATTADETAAAIATCDQLIDYCTRCLVYFPEPKFPAGAIWSAVVAAPSALMAASLSEAGPNKETLSALSKYALPVLTTVFLIVAVVGAVALIFIIVRERWTNRAAMVREAHERLTFKHQMAAYTRRRIELDTQRDRLQREEDHKQHGLPPAVEPRALTASRDDTTVGQRLDWAIDKVARRK